MVLEISIFEGSLLYGILVLAPSISRMLDLSLGRICVDKAVCGRRAFDATVIVVIVGLVIEFVDA